MSCGHHTLSFQQLLMFTLGTNQITQSPDKCRRQSFLSPPFLSGCSLAPGFPPSAHSPAQTGAPPDLIPVASNAWAAAETRSPCWCRSDGSLRAQPNFSSTNLHTCFDLKDNEQTFGAPHIPKLPALLMRQGPDVPRRPSSGTAEARGYRRSLSLCHPHGRRRRSNGQRTELPGPQLPHPLAPT